MKCSTPTLPQKSKAEKALQLLATRVQIAMLEVWYFLIYCVHTMDEHDPSVLYKPFPRKAYFRVLCRVWKEFAIIIMEKSRQILMTWFFTAMFFHDSIFSVARRVAFQSKKQPDADAILERARHILEGIRTIIERKVGKFTPDVKMTADTAGKSTELYFPKIKSRITSVPQGAHIFNSFAFSGIFSDEMNHQPKFREGIKAGLPTITGHSTSIHTRGRLAAIGTPNGHTHGWAILYGRDPDSHKPLGPHEFDTREVESKLFEPPETLHPDPVINAEMQRDWIEQKILSIPDEEFNQIPIFDLIAATPGLEYWRTAPAPGRSEGYDCFRVHYTADPDKDPATRRGKAWVKEAKRHMAPSDWEREMEFNYETRSGRPVISNWEKDRFVRKLEYDSELPLLLSFDFGTVLCLCIFGQYVPLKIDGEKYHQLRILREVVLRGSDTPTLAKETVQTMHTLFRRSWNNRHFKAYCDPTGDRASDTTSDKSLNTSIGILKTHGIYPSNKKFGCSESTELLETVFALSLPNGEPLILLDQSCTYLHKCCAGGLEYPPIGKGVEGHYIKDGEHDHGGDVMRYLANNVFTKYHLTGNQPPARPKSRAVHDPVTGRRIAIVDHSRRQLPARRGVHSLHG